jgi:MFS family permease
MIVLWTSVLFSFYSLIVLVNTFEQVYACSIASNVSFFIGYFASGVLVRELGVKKTFILSFAMSNFGSYMILFSGLEHQESWLFILYVTMLSLGTASAFNILYVANNKMFPTLCATTAMGVCNLISRIVAAFSSVIALKQEPIPMVVITSLNTIALFSAFRLKPPVQAYPSSLKN